MKNDKNRKNYVASSGELLGIVQKCFIPFILFEVRNKSLDEDDPYSSCFSIVVLSTLRDCSDSSKALIVSSYDFHSGINSIALCNFGALVNGLLH